MSTEWFNQPAKPSVLPQDYFHTPSPARMWNYLQGGKDNYPIDRAAGDAMAEVFPDIRFVAQQSRQFLIRAVRWAATEGGIRQFLDIGSGLPSTQTTLNTHEVAQEVHPDARIVYVDNDKVVLAHARALLVSSTPEGRCSYIDADVRDPELILAEAGDTLDFSEPIAVMFFGVLGHVVDFDEARFIVDRVMGAVPSGSYLLHTDGARTTPNTVEARKKRLREHGGAPYLPRTPEQLAQFFDGLELVEPGIGPVTFWRPDDGAITKPREIPEYGAVARKP